MKAPWVRPEIRVIDLRQAQGCNPGPRVDKYGSLSGAPGDRKCK